VPSHRRMRVVDRDLIRGGHYGQRSCEPHLQAEHMAAPTNAAYVKKVLAKWELFAGTNTRLVPTIQRLEPSRRGLLWTTPSLSVKSWNQRGIRGPHDVPVEIPHAGGCSRQTPAQPIAQTVSAKSDIICGAGRLKQ
jgi:hypothetical protein